MTQEGYEHSVTFALLKGYEETLEGNHTSAQYLETLDKMIDNALQPLIQSTSLFEGFVCQILGWQEANRKRKVSFLDRHEFLQLACAWLLLPTKVEKSLQSRRLRIERGALLEFLHTVIEASHNYLRACDATLTDDYGNLLPLEVQIAFRKEIEDAYNSPVTLRPYLLQSVYWTRQATRFKEMLLEKYIRFCLVNAQKDYVQVFETKVNLDDLIQGYMLAAMRAIDKCDARQGVLTPYIRTWFLTARASFLEELPTASRDNLEETETDDPDRVTEPTDLEEKQDIEYVRQVARLADPEGYGRAYLGIVESRTFIEDELTKLHLQ